MVVLIAPPPPVSDTVDPVIVEEVIVTFPPSE
jgi:hypothetical protein